MPTGNNPYGERLMPDIYDRSRALAIRMLAPRNSNGKGLAMQLIQVTEGEYDPATSGNTTTETVSDGSAFRDTYEDADIDGTLIQQSDVKFLVSPVLLDGSSLPEPQNGDQISFDGSRYQVMSVKPWNYAGLVIGYEVQGRA